MTREYQGFSIQNFRKGFDEAVEPWLLPGDAFQVVKNAHVYRGVVEKIRGYSLLAKFTSKTVTQLSGLLNGVNKTFTGTLASVPLTGATTVRATITAATGIVETFTDNGSGVLIGNLGGTGTINYTVNTPVGGQPAGYITVTFNSAPQDMTVAGIQYNAVMVTYDSTADGNPIMGIKPYYALDGSEEVIIFDTTRAGKVVPLTGTMQNVQQLNYGITEIPHEQQSASIVTGFNGTAGPFTGTVTAPLVPGTVQFLIFNNASPKVLVGTITDNGAGKLVSIATDTTRLDPAANNFINYATGKWTMTFLGGAPPNFPTASYTTNFSSCTYGPYFTGDFTNFFTVANWMGYMFITNAIDAPRYYDGMCVKFLNTSINPDPLAVAPYTLTRVTHLVVYNNRLVLLGAYSNNVPALSTAFWSKIDEPLDFTNNEFEPATTSEPIRAFFLITVNLVVRFANSERILTYTGDPFGPFRWDSTNNLWRCDARYSAINYDSWGSSVGLAAIVGSDGVNIKRVDEIIPDFTLNLRIDEQQPVPSIDQGSIGQCYGQRFDDFKEGWLCYKDYTTTDDQGGPLPSDSVLSFNYIDGTYAVYTFPFSVLGFGRITNTETWGNTFTLWEETFSTWDSYSQTTGALIDLGGDQNGRIYELGFGNSITDEDGNVIPCLMDIITKDFNPFVEEGQYARFGYVDFLVSSNDQTTFRVQFYKDNQLTDSFNTAYQETSLVLTGNTQSKVWKRIYVGAVGKCHTMRIYQNAADFTDTLQNQPIRIHAIVPYFKAAGRIFNP